MPNDDSPPYVDVRNVGKSYFGVPALQGIDIAFRAGEVHAVVGENGAGKSTLMKILAGVTQLDQGEIRVRDRAVDIQSVPTAQSLGIAMIHQELNLCDNLDIGSNIYLAREPTRFGRIDQAKIDAAATRHLAAVGLDLSPRTRVDQLTIGKQQLVEIAKAVSSDAKMLIMDEPTSSLTQHETEKLFAVVRQLRDQGVAIAYISHRLAEVGELADRVTVLRDGRVAGRLTADEVSHDRMVQLMVGRDISQFYPRDEHTVGTSMLEVRDLRTRQHPQHALDFEVRAGEIVGLAGLVGAGRTEVLSSLFGVLPALTGRIRIADQLVAIDNPRDAIDAGVALVPEDRKQQGLILDMSIRHNIGLTGLARHQRTMGLHNFSREREVVSTMIRKLRIKSTDDRQLTKHLSGGNQQKVALAKWLAMQPRVLLLDEPTRGVDIGAKQEIYRFMEELAGQGVAILFASSEMEEVLSLSDRVLVMHEGRIAGELSRPGLSEEHVMQLATGSRIPDESEAIATN